MDVTPSKDAKSDDLIIDEWESKTRPPVTESRYMRWIFATPWWAITLLLIMVAVARLISSDPNYRTIFGQLRKGLWLTLYISFAAYLIALILGLIIGVIRSTSPRPQSGLRRGFFSFMHLLIYQFATFFVEVMRGLPTLIVLLIAAFVITPNFKDFMLETFNIELNFKGSSVQVAIAALSMNYAAYLSEIFRAGIQSIEKGQIEAARSLGMTSFQSMRLIVLPQATRRVIPPLGNNFIAMIKDSSLASVLGIREISQQGKLWSGSTFRFEQTYLVVAVLYLTMTVLGSIAVRYIERYLKTDDR
jgi:polar amino acid transport system permease protein